MKQDLVAKRRSEILEASIDVFAEKGYHAAKISDIAEKLEIGHGTFYRYFKNKLDIFTAIADSIIEKVAKMVATEAPGESNSVEEYRAQLFRIGKSLFSIFTDDVRMFKIAYYELLGVDPHLNERLENAMKIFNQYTEAYLINGVVKGFLKPEIDTQVISRAVNGMIFTGCKSVIEAEDSQLEYERWMNSISLLMLDGMSKRIEG